MTFQKKAVSASSCGSNVVRLALAVAVLCSVGAAWAQTGRPATKYTFTSFYPGGVADKYGAAYGIDNAGDVVGDYYASSGWDGYERLADGTFNPVDYSGNSTVPVGINSGGTIIVGAACVPASREMLSLLDNARNLGFCTSKGYQIAGFLYQNGSFTQYEFPGNLPTGIDGINDSGAYVGFYSQNKTNTGFISNGNTVSYNGGYTHLNSINDNGVIVGTGGLAGAAGAVGFEANTSGQITSTLQYPGSISTSANGINNQGVVVGMYVDSSGVGHGYIYKKGKYTTLPVPPGAVKNKFQYWGINDSGQLSGSYTDKNYEVWGFVATP